MAAAIGVAKNDNLIDIALLEHCVREDLNERAPRAMAVLRPRAGGPPPECLRHPL